MPRFDSVIDALGHQYRRHLLVALLDSNPQDDDDAQGAEEALGALVDSEVNRVTVETKLDHVHLPKLEDYGYITWDRESGEIAKGPNWAEVEPVVRLLRDHEDDLPEGWL